MRKWFFRRKIYDECPKGGKRESHTIWGEEVDFWAGAKPWFFDIFQSVVSSWPCSSSSRWYAGNDVGIWWLMEDQRYDVFGIADLMAEHLRRSRVDTFCPHHPPFQILYNFQPKMTSGVILTDGKVFSAAICPFFLAIFAWDLWQNPATNGNHLLSCLTAMNVGQKKIAVLCYISYRKNITIILWKQLCGKGRLIVFFPETAVINLCAAIFFRIWGKQFLEDLRQISKIKVRF